jgi:acetyltransferase-like isoleucine patch superfamily enzyme
MSSGPSTTAVGGVPPIAQTLPQSDGMAAGVRAPAHSVDTGAASGRVRRVFKWLGNAVALGLAAVPALCSNLELRFTGGDELFGFFGQAFGVAPGLPGKYLRRAYYYLTLELCSLTCDIGFLSYCNDRRTRIGEGVYVGCGVSLGAVSLGAGSLIGSRASILSGAHQHRFGPDGKLTAFDRASASLTHIGEQTWIGEGAILMADVGSRCIVAAGSVVATPVPDGCKVGGNPARFIGKTTEDNPQAGTT